MVIANLALPIAVKEAEATLLSMSGIMADGHLLGSNSRQLPEAVK